MDFELHPRLAADTLVVGDLPLCRVLLMNDKRYPWCVLVPRRPGLREIYELDEPAQRTLVAESSRLGRVLMQEFGGDKLNVAALGNLVAQLHLHHVVRRVGDDAWPAPVWGRHSPQLYEPDAAAARVERLRQLLAPELLAT
ncbi:MAG TPA: HIT family protein [Solimonas sp.]|nr:HIT family protein [Solimonas sp.]